jgi:hypothetical protein
MEYLLERIKAGRKNTVTVRFGDSDIDAALGSDLVTVRLLTVQDTLEASFAADRIFADSGTHTVSMQNIKAYEAEKDVQNLYRACADEDGKPLAASVAEFRRLLTVADKERLIDAYNRLDAEANPSADTMSDAEFDELVETVKKNPNTASNVSSINTLRKLTRYLAAALAISPQVNGHT